MSTRTCTHAPSQVQRVRLSPGDVAPHIFSHIRVPTVPPPPHGRFMNNASAFASQKAWMVGPGNHEAECHSARCIAEGTLRKSLDNFRCGGAARGRGAPWPLPTPSLRCSARRCSAYNTRFRMPYEASGSTTSMCVRGAAAAWPASCYTHAPLRSAAAPRAAAAGGTPSATVPSTSSTSTRRRTSPAVGDDGEPIPLSCTQDADPRSPHAAPLDEVAGKNGGFGDQLAWVEANLQQVGTAWVCFRTSLRVTFPVCFSGCCGPRGGPGVVDRRRRPPPRIHPRVLDGRGRPYRRVQGAPGRLRAPLSQVRRQP